MAIFNNFQKKKIKSLLDDMINSFGKDCKLYYPPELVDCTSCLSPVNDTYWAGTTCEVCNGTHKKEQEVTGTIKMTCNWNDKPFLTPDGKVALPYSIVQTRGFLTDMPKVLACNEMRIQTPESGYIVGRYRLESMPGDQFSIIEGRYFLCVWTRIG